LTSFSDWQTHDFRKSKLKNMLDNEGFSLTEVSAYARHASVQTTMLYVGESSENVVKKMQQNFDKECQNSKE